MRSMAIVHRATISPTKQEIATAWLDAHDWGGVGPVVVLGSYRYDDPAGEVGVESLVVRRGDDHFQLPLTYRGAPLEDVEEVSTMEHSVLGSRWIYLATSDPVGIECHVKALVGELTQADMEVWDGDVLVARRETGVTLTPERGPGGGGEDVPSATATVAAGRLVVPFVLGGDPGGTHRLVGRWQDGGPAVVAALEEPRP